jgi:NAD(P)-dependent dehydrogenase (short-subunit alcohol dehydrogenase family)
MSLLNGKVVIVTGAGRGIGRAIALAMAASGAAVVVNDVGTSSQGEGADQTPAQSVVNEIVAAGGRAVANYDSVADWDAAHSIVATAIKNFGRIDGVVNNAGILRDVIFHKMTKADFESVINVHLIGAFNVSRAAAEHFRKQEGGFLVHMSSTSGLIGNVGQANYCAAKLGIVALSKAIALDMKRFNVRSNCIAPAAATRMTDTIPAEQKERLARIALQTPDKVAPLVVALGAEQSRVTGQVFFIRRNEIFLMSQSRPIREMHNSDGWTPETIVQRVFPAFAASFFPLDVAGEVFNWDPT